MSQSLSRRSFLKCAGSGAVSLAAALLTGVSAAAAQPRVMGQPALLDGKAVVAVLNNGDTPAQLEFQLPVEAAKVTDLMADTVGAQEVLVSTEWNRMKVQLPSNYATLLRVE